MEEKGRFAEAGTADALHSEKYRRAKTDRFEAVCTGGEGVAAWQTGSNATTLAATLIRNCAVWFASSSVKFAFTFITG